MFADVAYAMGAPNGGGGGMGSLTSFLPLVLMFVVFYFLLIWPQQKKAKAHRQVLCQPAEGRQRGYGFGNLRADHRDHRHHRHPGNRGKGPDQSIPQRRGRGREESNHLKKSRRLSAAWRKPSDPYPGSRWFARTDSTKVTGFSLWAY